MVKFLNGLFETKGEEEVRHATAGRLGAFTDMPYRSEWSTERAVQDGLLKVPLVFKCVDTIATAASRLPIVVRKGGRGSTFPEIADHPVAQKFAARVNEYEYGSQFIYRMFALLLLSKQGVFVEHLRSNRGKLAGLYILPSDQTFPVPGDGKFVTRYEIEGVQGQRFTLQPEQVMWVRKPHPTDPYSSLTPMEAAGVDIDTNFYARLFNRDFMLSDGRPAGLISVKGGMADEDVDELRRRFSGSGRTSANGGGRAGDVSVVSADQVSWVDLQTNQRDAQYVESMGITQKDIMLAFGVPESVMGDASGRTFSNADAEKEVFWEATMLPLLDIVFAALGEVTGAVEDGEHLAADVSEVDVLQRNKRDNEDRLRTLFNDGLIHADEFREGTGRAPVARPGARVLYIPVQGKIAVGMEADESSASEATVLGGAPAADEAAGPSPALAAPKGVGARGRSSRAMEAQEQKHGGPGPHGNGSQQSTHGRIKPSGIGKRTLADGGMTIDLSTNSYPSTGFALSLDLEAEINVPFEEFDANYADIIGGFVTEHADRLDADGKHLGTWLDTDSDLVFLDISTIVDDRDEALDLARVHQQRAIFDLATFDEIEVTPADELERIP
jgi:HK97 family phage portal protein